MALHLRSRVDSATLVVGVHEIQGIDMLKSLFHLKQEAADEKSEHVTIPLDVFEMAAATLLVNPEGVLDALQKMTSRACPLQASHLAKLLVSSARSADDMNMYMTLFPGRLRDVFGTPIPLLVLRNFWVTMPVTVSACSRLTHDELCECMYYAVKSGRIDAMRALLLGERTCGPVPPVLRRHNTGETAMLCLLNTGCITSGVKNVSSEALAILSHFSDDRLELDSAVDAKGRTARSIRRCAKS